MFRLNVGRLAASLLIAVCLIAVLAHVASACPPVAVGSFAVQAVQSFAYAPQAVAVQQVYQPQAVAVQAVQYAPMQVQAFAVQQYGVSAFAAAPAVVQVQAVHAKQARGRIFGGRSVSVAKTVVRSR